MRIWKGSDIAEVPEGGYCNSPAHSKAVCGYLDWSALDRLYRFEMSICQLFGDKVYAMARVKGSYVLPGFRKCARCFMAEAVDPAWAV